MIIDYNQFTATRVHAGTVRYVNTILQDKMLFGSDWPVITPDRWMADFEKLDIRDEVRPKVLKANARKLLGI